MKDRLSLEASSPFQDVEGENEFQPFKPSYISKLYADEATHTLTYRVLKCERDQ
jgi:hypothetical protein